MSAAVLSDIWSGLAVILYVLATFLLFRSVLRKGNIPGSSVNSLIILAVITHGLALLMDFTGGGGINISLSAAMSTIAWVVVGLFLIARIQQPVDSLGLVILPYASVAVLLAWLWSAPPVKLDHLDPLAIAHILIAVVAYGLLALAFCQAILVLLQEWQLQHKHAGSVFHALPPLDRMERILFQIIGVGFFLLTITLISGIFFAREIFGKAFVFNHHVVLSVIAWLSFGGLLVARAIWGWRGRVAAIWTISSFAVLVLAYFGTRFVMEVVLSRA